MGTNTSMVLVACPEGAWSAAVIGRWCVCLVRLHDERRTCHNDTGWGKCLQELQHETYIIGNSHGSQIITLIKGHLFNNNGKKLIAAYKWCRLSVGNLLFFVVDGVRFNRVYSPGATSRGFLFQVTFSKGQLDRVLESKNHHILDILGPKKSHVSARKSAEIMRKSSIPKVERKWKWGV